MLFVQVWFISFGSVVSYMESAYGLGDYFEPGGMVIEEMGRTFVEFDEVTIYQSVRII